jgi:PHD/YefM family antitoxin component YafN of YafNO toxin-antitoxin module
MNYRYELPAWTLGKVSEMEEFANGATQVTIITGDGRTHSAVLISGSRYIIAMRGAADLPFSPDAIVEVRQTEEDKNPKQRGGWQYWDQWHA